MTSPFYINLDTRTQIQEITNYLDSSHGTEKKIVEAVIANNKMIKKIMAVNKLEKLLIRKIGTSKIEAVARQIEGDPESRRSEEAVMYVIKKQIGNAKKCLKEKRKEAREKERIMREALPQGWRRRKAKEVIKVEGNRMWDITRQKMKETVNFLENKIKGGQGREQYGDIRIGDEVMENEDDNEEEDEYVEEEIGEQEPIAIGIELNEAQKEYLKLPAGMAIHPKYDRDQYMTDINVTADKLRWTLNNQEEVKSVETKEEEKEWMKQVKDEIDTTKVTNMEDKTVRFARMRVTELKSCRRITIPKELKNQDIERKIQTMVSRLEEVVLEEERRLKTVPKEQLTTLTKEQSAGRDSLLEAQRNKEAVILTSDKSGKMAAAGPQNLRDMIAPHVINDEIVDRSAVETAEKTLSACAEQLARVLRLGEDHGHQARVNAAMRSVSSKVPTLDALVKDHKDTIPLPIRGVCKARQSPNGILGDLVSDMLVAMVSQDHVETTHGVKSTEEMISKIEDLNRLLKEEEEGENGEEAKQTEIGIGSFDVKAMYPELDIKECAKTVRRQIEQSNMIIETNNEEMALMLASLMTQEEIDETGLKRVIPQRNKHMGSRPQITSKAITGSPKERAENESWTKPGRKPTEIEARKMLGILMEILINIVMENHFYTTENVIRRQTKGGAIGLRLTGVLAELFMIEWIRLFRKKLEEVRIAVKMTAVYVDDINQAMRLVELGSRYKNEKIEITEETRQEDENNKIDRVKLTFKIAREIGDTICNFVKLTTDTPDTTRGGYMPVLDLQVKMGEGDNKRRVVYKFYAKEVSTKYTILRQSAHSSKIKFSTLVQECVRRLLNTSDLVTKEEKREIMEAYNCRMKRSGYRGEYRERVIRAAHEIYAVKKVEHENGTRPLHRDKKWQSKERQIKKDISKAHWYRKGKKGGNEITHAPLIVNPSHENKLTDKIKMICQETAKLTGIRVKVLERGGNKLARDAKSDPLAEAGCSRTTCGICIGENKGKCSEYGVTYEVSCVNCLKEKVIAKYIGETGRNGFSRKLEHDQAIQSKQMNNALAKHCKIQHDDQKAEFKMSITGTYRTCLERQEAEAVKVRRAQATVDILMNSRNDFHQPPIRRVVTETGNSQADQPGAEALGIAGNTGLRRGTQTRGRGRGRGTAAADRETGDRRQNAGDRRQETGEVRGRGPGRPRGRPRRVQ
jgi:hypothetical protein